MTIDAKKLSIATESYMISQDFTKSSVKVADGGWEKDDLLYCVEEKTERESIIPSGSWWKWEKDDLLGQRNHICDHYRDKNRLIFHENKWMIVIAQLRASILRLSNINRCYRSLFIIPSKEVSNFRQGFANYHADPDLNTAIQGQAICLNVRQDTLLTYLDQRNISIQISFVEIVCDNYFGPI